MQRTNIEWADYVFNPIKGMCPIDCKLPDGQSYCYARKIYERFTPQWRGWGDSDEPFVLADEFVQLDKLKKPSRIFVCSTFELFHPSVKKHIHWVFNAIEKNPQHTFQILTKMPENIDRPMPDNVWLGVSITKPVEMYPMIKALYEAQAKLKFISFEPLLGDVGQFHFQGFYRTPDGKLLRGKADWIIVGRLTGHGHKYDPKDYWITSLVYHAKKFNTPIFLKNNLKGIWKKPLIQEFPHEEGK